MPEEGLPFSTVLSEATVAPALDAIEGFWKDRIYTPLVTLWVFLGQVLSADHSCRNAVARLITHRLSRGESPCSPLTAAYSQARKRLPELDDEIVKLCCPVWSAELPPTDGPANDYRLLVNELMGLMVAQELFTFVTAAPTAAPNGQTQPVSGTNNEAERTLRGAARARKTGRTSKTPAGARRRTVIVSVLESLRQHLPAFTMTNILAEVLHWSAAGQSCFTKLLATLHLPPAAARPWTSSPPPADHPPKRRPPRSESTARGRCMVRIE